MVRIVLITLTLLGCQHKETPIKTVIHNENCIENNIKLQDDKSILLNSGLRIPTEDYYIH